jgi:hypothetical protein
MTLITAYATWSFVALAADTRVVNGDGNPIAEDVVKVSALNARILVAFQGVANLDANLDPGFPGWEDTGRWVIEMASAAPDAQDLVDTIRYGAQRAFASPRFAGEPHLFAFAGWVPTDGSALVRTDKFDTNDLAPVIGSIGNTHAADGTFLNDPSTEFQRWLRPLKPTEAFLVAPLRDDVDRSILGRLRPGQTMVEVANVLADLHASCTSPDVGDDVIVAFIPRNGIGVEFIDIPLDGVSVATDAVSAWGRTSDGRWGPAKLPMRSVTEGGGRWITR